MCADRQLGVGMASIEEAFKKVLALEFNSPANALHWNKGESGCTYMGIYEAAHPTWVGWNKIKKCIDVEGSLALASSKLYYDKELTRCVCEFYKKQFWDKMRLDEVASQKIAEELMVFAVNAGIGTAVKVAQKVVGVTADGVLGSGTIKALNGFDEKKFDKEFDLLEIKHYELLAEKNPNFKKFLQGWKNRAVAV